MPEYSTEVTVFSPAKINLHLSVKDRRPDGFHNLESVFLAVNFGDTLYFQAGNDEFEADFFIPGNIILKAVTVFREKTGFSQGLKVRLKKRIPLGGGLGGGSSNAAAVLLALNKIAGFPLNRESLLETASSLGSDVPFFIYETAAARVKGRGEQIEPIDAPDLSLVLVNPGFPSDTARAFRLLDEYRNHEFLFANQPKGAHKPARTKERHDITGSWLNFRNDFLEVFPQKEKSVYNEIISGLREQGAQFANLSGTGSTCFGIFSGKEKARNAAEVLCKKWEFVQECSSLC